MNKIADYDTLNYDYRQYWKNREYENTSESIALEKLLSGEKGSWFIDIGGSYGRLTPLYYSKYENCIVVDYSLKTLQNNYQYIKENFPNTILLCANAYKLPFKDNSFDTGLMVRVLHHIDRPKEYFQEVHRTLSENSIYIQEYANKKHFKAVVRGILKLDFSVFSRDPFQQPNRDNYEGARKDSYVPFLNYHPAWIKSTLENTGFTIISESGCSFFRLNLLKKIFGTKTLVLFEKIFQQIFSWTHISPSIFVKSKVKKEKSKDFKRSRLEDILVCPACKGGLKIKEEAHCVKCNRKYSKKKNIWDFRV